MYREVRDYELKPLADHDKHKDKNNYQEKFAKLIPKKVLFEKVCLDYDDTFPLFNREISSYGIVIKKRRLYAPNSYSTVTLKYTEKEGLTGNIYDQVTKQITYKDKKLITHIREKMKQEQNQISSI